VTTHGRFSGDHRGQPESSPVLEVPRDGAVYAEWRQTGKLLEANSRQTGASVAAYYAARRLLKEMACPPGKCCMLNRAGSIALKGCRPLCQNPPPGTPETVAQ
jgi:hypothetical protein